MALKVKGYSRRSRRNYIFAGLAVLFLALQLGFPADRVVPRTYVGATNVSLKKKSDVEALIAQQTKTLQLRFDDKNISVAPSQVGITTNVSRTAEQLPSVRLIDRFIPFAPLYKSLIKTEIDVAVKYDDKKVKAYAQKISQELKTDPVDADSEVKDGNLIIRKDKPGKTYDADQIEKAILNQSLFMGPPLRFIAKTKPADVKVKDLQPLKTEYSKKTASPLTVTFDNKSKTVQPDELKKWLMVQEDPLTKQSSLVLDPAGIQPQLQAWAKEYNISPGITQISYRDDVEISRNTGASGRALNEAAIKDQISQWFNNPTSEPVALTTMVVAPTIVADRTYSRTSAQLQAQINNWVANNKGKYQIAIKELGGRGREASYNVSERTVMASTYKPFLAFVAYKQAQNGALNLNATVDGRSIESCIEVMIIVSNNSCAVELGKYIGWAKVDQVIAESGFEGIVLNNYHSDGSFNGDKLVNAREQAKFLAQLSAGSLIDQTNTDKLISYMKRQSYSRAGIPAGSRGAPVANKVGVLYNYLHDVGIVYGPKSTYALVIMSEGSSWTNIKDLSQAVYDFMNE